MTYNNCIHGAAINEDCTDCEMFCNEYAEYLHIDRVPECLDIYMEHLTTIVTLDRLLTIAPR